MFREPEKRPPAVLSNAFTLGVLSPILLLVVAVSTGDECIVVMPSYAMLCCCVFHVYDWVSSLLRSLSGFCIFCSHLLYFFVFFKFLFIHSFVCIFLPCCLGTVDACWS